eukprot:759807-Hanusia_phi.AAC.2
MKEASLKSFQKVEFEVGMLDLLEQLNWLQTEDIPSISEWMEEWAEKPEWVEQQDRMLEVVARRGRWVNQFGLVFAFALLPASQPRSRLPNHRQGHSIHAA